LIPIALAIPPQRDLTGAKMRCRLSEPIPSIRIFRLRGIIEQFQLLPPCGTVFDGGDEIVMPVTSLRVQF
jgi:hypothetical protein